MEKKLNTFYLVVIAILTIVCVSLFAVLLSANDGYHRVIYERNDLQNQVNELRRENDCLQWEVEHPQNRIVSFASVR